MTIYVESTGDGPDLVLLHGWGLHGGLFRPLVRHLENDFRIHAVDLPGHGRSAPVGRTLTDWMEAVRKSVPATAHWLGWSLGGLVSMALAHADARAVDRLVLVASTPRFTTDADWSHAQAPAMLERFAADLRTDHRKTVSDFLTLQSLGDAHAREQVRELRSHVFDHGDPDPVALEAGLAILRDTDLRATLPEIRQHTLLIAGRRDRLTPPGAMRAMAEDLPAATYEEVPGAAHAPFLSDPAAFAARVKEFVRGG